MILQVAARLFSALGYDGTSSGQIAEAAGLSPDVLREEFGGKRELYLAVLDRAYLAERESLEAALKGFVPSTPEETAAVIHRIVDHYIDYCLVHPETPALRMHRWLADAGDLVEPEREYMKPLMDLVSMVIDAAAEAGHVGPDVDLRYIMWTLMWSVNGFLMGGVLNRDGGFGGAEDPVTLRWFRTNLHRTVHRAAGLPGPPA
ncbi:hypothetical protein GCM10010517_28360 [Streptosporangium fragile]|uniref:HTH tetR-type domain-containing protein n=2 Tax=Streptosporangium fragile TaxID=46186 RepID=A0ABN3VXL4_9ACTN